MFKKSGANLSIDGFDSDIFYNEQFLDGKMCRSSLLYVKSLDIIKGKPSYNQNTIFFFQLLINGTIKK